MNSFKNLFKLAQESIPIDSVLKFKLAKQCFKNPPQKKSLWRHYKVFFAAPVLATLALTAFWILPSSSQRVIAHALDNTFNSALFESHFGFPGDSQFHHRTIEHKFYHGKENPVEFSQVIDLWFDGESLREDNVRGFGGMREFLSIMADIPNDMFCRVGSEYRYNGCESLSKYHSTLQANQKNDSSFAIQDEEVLLVDLDQVIAQPHSNGEKNAYLLHFYTNEPLPLSQAYVKIGDDLAYVNRARSVSGDVVITDQYFNQFQEGLYHHSLPFFQRMDDIYFQLIITEKPFTDELLMSAEDGFNYFGIQNKSMLYHLNVTTNQIEPIDPQELQTAMSLPANHAASQAIKEKLLTTTLNSAFYLMSNPELLSHPKNRVLVEKNGIMLTKYSYSLEHSDKILSHIHDYPEGDYSIDIYLNSQSQHFKGYAIYVDGVPLESLWIEDNILNDAEKDTIFNPERWELKVKTNEAMIYDINDVKKIYEQLMTPLD